MKFLWYSAFLSFSFSLRTNGKNGHLYENNFRQCYDNFSNKPFWKLLNHSYVWSSFSSTTSDITVEFWKTANSWKFDGHWSAYVLILSSKLVKTLWNENRRSWLESCTKIRTFHLKESCTKIDHIWLTFICFFFSKTNLFFKSNLVLIGILDSFCHSLLPFDYHLSFH